MYQTLYASKTKFWYGEIEMEFMCYIKSLHMIVKDIRIIL